MLTPVLLGAHLTYPFKGDYEKGRRQKYRWWKTGWEKKQSMHCAKKKETPWESSREKRRKKKNPNFCKYVSLGLRLCQTLDLEAVLSLIHCTWLSVARKTFFVVLKNWIILIWNKTNCEFKWQSKKRLNSFCKPSESLKIP